MRLSWQRSDTDACHVKSGLDAPGSRQKLRRNTDVTANGTDDTCTRRNTYRALAAAYWSTVILDIMHNDVNYSEALMDILRALSLSPWSCREKHRRITWHNSVESPCEWTVYILIVNTPLDSNNSSFNILWSMVLSWIHLSCRYVRAHDAHLCPCDNDEEEVCLQLARKWDFNVLFF